MHERAAIGLHAESGNWLARHRVELVKGILKSNGLSENSTVIDLGAGSGFGVEVLSDTVACDALEPSSFFVESIRARSSARTVFQDVIPPQLAHDFDSYDAVVMMDVLEHLPNEDNALSWIRTIMKSSDSKLVVTVPAYQWLFSYHDVNVHHFRRYSRKSLTLQLNRSGLDVVKVSYFVTLLFPVALVARALGSLIHRLRRQSSAKASSSVSPPIDSLFAAVCRVERRLLERTNLPFGLSLVAVCRRGSVA